MSTSDREIPDTELPGMWERGDFVGGAPDVVRTSGPPSAPTPEPEPPVTTVPGRDLEDPQLEAAARGDVEEGQ